MFSLLRVYRGLGGLAQLVIGVLLWLNFAPAQIGGRTTYIILSGNSMAPNFHRGDLVLVHSDAEYKAGDVIAYRHPLIGAVFHRIIDQEGDRFVMRGDNNTWDDSYMPVPEDIIGKLWARVPLVGNLLTKLRQPGLLALFSLGAGTALVTTAAASQDTGREPRRKRSAASRKSSSPQPMPQDVRNMLGILTLGALALLVFVSLRPAYIDVPTTIPYQHHAEFQYSANVPGNLYDQAQVQPGEPIFRRITDSFNVTLDYRFTAEKNIENFNGTLQLNAVLSESNGWKHTIQLQPALEFEGPAAEASAEIDISQLQGFMNTLEELTGLSPSEYALSIQPQISVEGTVGGQALSDEFAPSLDFIINPLQVRLADNQLDGGQTLQQSQEGMIQIGVQQVNTLAIFGAKVNIFVARIIALLVFAVLGVLTLFAFVRARNLARLPEMQRIQSIYGSNIVQVKGIKFDPEQKMTEVASVEDLLHLSEQEGRSVLCERRADGVYYFLATEAIVYFFHSPSGMLGG